MSQDLTEYPIADSTRRVYECRLKHLNAWHSGQVERLADLATVFKATATPTSTQSCKSPALPVRENPAKSTTYPTHTPQPYPPSSPEPANQLILFN